MAHSHRQINKRHKNHFFCWPPDFALLCGLQPVEFRCLPACGGLVQRRGSYPPYVQLRKSERSKIGSNFFGLHCLQRWILTHVLNPSQRVATLSCGISFRKLGLLCSGLKFHGVVSAYGRGTYDSNDPKEAVIKHMRRSIMMDASRISFVHSILRVAFSELDHNERCLIMLGAPGLGKTKLLDALVHALPTARHCFAIKIDLRLFSFKIIDVVAREIGKQGFALPEAAWLDVQNFLIRENIRLFLFVDEVEDVLSKPNFRDEPIFKELHGIGDDDVGGWWALLCGSIKELVALRFRLNGRKFNPISLRLAPVDEWSAILDHFDVTPHKRNAAFWFTGGLYANLAKYKNNAWEPEVPIFASTQYLLVNLCTDLCRCLCRKVHSIAQSEVIAEGQRNVVVTNGFTTDEAVALLKASYFAWVEAELSQEEIKTILYKSHATNDDLEMVIKMGVLRWDVREFDWTVKVGVPAYCWEYAVRNADTTFIAELSKKVLSLPKQIKESGVLDMLQHLRSTVPWVRELLRLVGLPV